MNFIWFRESTITLFHTFSKNNNSCAKSALKPSPSFARPHHHHLPYQCPRYLVIFPLWWAAGHLSAVSPLPLLSRCLWPSKQHHGGCISRRQQGGSSDQSCRYDDNLSVKGSIARVSITQSVGVSPRRWPRTCELINNRRSVMHSHLSACALWYCRHSLIWSSCSAFSFLSSLFSDWLRTVSLFLLLTTADFLTVSIYFVRIFKFCDIVEAFKITKSTQHLKFRLCFTLEW